MSDSNLNNSTMDDLLFLLVEGALDAEGVSRVEAWLRSGEEAKRHYLDFISDYAAMKGQAKSLIDMEEGEFSIHDEFDAQLWSALAEVERVSERVPEAKEEVTEPQATAAPAERPRRRMKVSRSSVIAFVVAEAAILLIILFLRISPSSVEVATITDSMGAVFASEAAQPAGSRLSNRKDSLWLQKGAVTIAFDYGAEVVIEAPAEFRLNSAEDMTLLYGRLYAHVPGRSKGFSVATPSASIIDLGTEFAVKVDFDGTSDVHTIQGKVSLIPGAKGQTTGESRILTASEARQIRVSGEVSEIPLKATDFLRAIDSRTGFAWRGHRTLDLADMVGGGNGLGSGKLEYGINPETGAMAYRDRSRFKVSTYQGFQAVEASPYVDGVFCPFQDNASIQISTRGDVFDHCPLTSGTYWGYVMNSGWFGQASRQEGFFNENLQLGGQVYGSRQYPAIAMHSNCGVTFDLEAIRKSIGDFTIQRFTSLCGISELVMEKQELDVAPKASFMVLLDGRAVYERMDASPLDGAAQIDVEIGQEARFLSLVITEGSDRSYDGDWTLFAEPKLHFEKAE